jgi:hypothetical protein
VTTHTRAIVGAGVSALAVLVAAFLAGRASAPQAAVKDTRTATIATQEVSHSASSAHVEAIAHKTSAADVETKTVTVVKWLPAAPSKAGCPELPAHVEQETTTETHAVTARTADTQRAAVVAKRQDQRVATQQTVVELHTSTPARPTWSGALMPGAQLFGSKAITLYGPLVLGASIEHRFAGPVSLGVWGSTSGAVGITVRW